MKVIIYTNENENISICIPTGELPIEEVLKKDCPENAIIVDAELLPNEHHEFFNAWELVDGSVLVNFAKAQEITKDRLRTERTPLLAAQDVAFQRALESGADTSSIVAEKNRLRDVTKLVDTATTLDELKGLSCQ